MLRELLDHIDAVGTHMQQGETEEVFDAIECLEGNQSNPIQFKPVQLDDEFIDSLFYILIYSFM